MGRRTFSVAVYCTIDEWLRGRPPRRQRGFAPALSDGAALTMEVVGEFLGIAAGTGRDRYFCRHDAAWFPARPRRDRSTFARQAAGLCWAQGRRWRRLAAQAAPDPALAVVDSFPVPGCRVARARRCRRLRAESAYGHEQADRRTSDGLRAHSRICWPGVIVATSLAPATADEMAVAEADLPDEAAGWVLGGRNYRRPQAAARLRERAVAPCAPCKWAARDPQPWPQWLTDRRRRVATSIGQLPERFHAKKVWARAAWHLPARWFRKPLRHTLARLLRQRAGLSPLAFDQLVACEAPTPP